MQTAFVVLALAFFVFAFALPVLRLRLKTGTWILVFHREAEPLQRVVGAAFGTLFFGYLAWTVALLLIPQHLDLWTAPRAVVTAGLALMGLGTFGVALSQADMGGSLRIGIDDRPTDLVTGGLFRLVRNPIFTSMAVFLAGVALATPSPWSVSLLVGTLYVIVLQVRLEEQHLVKMHGERYLAYARRVGRFLPGLGRMRNGAARPRPSGGGVSGNEAGARS